MIQEILSFKIWFPRDKCSISMKIEVYIVDSSLHCEAEAETTELPKKYKFNCTMH